MQGGHERAYGGRWRDRFGGRRLGDWRRRVSWPLLAACALGALQRFVPALAIDDWLRGAGAWLAWPAELVPRPAPTVATSEATLERAWGGVAAARERLRAAEQRATSPRGRVILDASAPGGGAEVFPPPTCFVEVRAKPAVGSRWQLAAVAAHGRGREALAPRGAIALWRQMVVGRVAPVGAAGEPLELVLSSEKGQRFPVVYRGAKDAIGSGVLVAGPFATPSGRDAAFRLLHPTCDPLSPDEPLRLCAGPERYRASIGALEQGTALAEEARQLAAGAGFIVARFQEQRSFADGWYADAVFDPSYVHGVHLAGITEGECLELPAREPLCARVRDAWDVDAGARSAGLDLGTSSGLRRGDAVLAHGVLIGEIAAPTSQRARVCALDDEGRVIEALLLGSDGDLRQLGRLRSRGRAGDAWVLSAEEPLPAALSGELFAGASVRAGWKGLPLGLARVSADGLELRLPKPAWSSGEMLALCAEGRN